MCEMNTKELWPGNPDIVKNKNMSANCSKLITLRVHPAVLVCDFDTVFNSFNQFKSLIDKAKYLVVVPTFVATEINDRKLHGLGWADTVLRYLLQSRQYLSFVNDNGKQTEILPEPPAIHKTKKSDERLVTAAKFFVKDQISQDWTNLTRRRKKNDEPETNELFLDRKVVLLTRNRAAAARATSHNIPTCTIHEFIAWQNKQ